MRPASERPGSAYRLSGRQGGGLRFQIDGLDLGDLDGDVTEYFLVQGGGRGNPDAVNEARLLAEGIVRTVREPLLVLDGQLHVQSANDSFFRTFQVTPEETLNRLLYELDHPLRHRLRPRQQGDDQKTGKCGHAQGRAGPNPGWSH